MPYSELLNQVLTVSIGGQSFTGIATKVAEDFFVVTNKDLGPAILPFEHVKRIGIGSNRQVETAGTSPIVSMTEFNVPELPNQFHQALVNLLQTVVQLEGGGPNPTVGYLMEVKRDYLTMCVIPDGIVYFHTPHVQAAIPLDVSVRPEFTTWAAQEREQLVRADSFHQVLKAHMGKLVTFGRNSPESLPGIVANVSMDYVEVLTSPRDSLWLPLRHVKSMTSFIRVEWYSQQPLVSGNSST